MTGHSGERIPGTWWPKGDWGNPGCPPQRGIESYSISMNRQRAMAGTLHAAVFNSWRRFKGQVLYFAPPLIAGYLCMQWALDRNKYLNSKEGRKSLEGE